jgi:membrane protein DedA with SNARE-associated domain
MLDGVVESVEAIMGSPWVYLALYAIATIDAFFPVVPSETLVISAGVFAAASGEPNVVIVVLVAAAGAFTGDHISYFIGRYGGGALLARFGQNKAVAGAMVWARKELEIRGGLVLVISRYIPGGRTATTMTCGATGFPLRKFSFFDAIAALSWAIYSTAIGYLAGNWFEGDPIRGLMLGLGIAVAITVIVEGVRHLRRRAGRDRVGEQAAGVAQDGASDPNA